MRWISLFRLSTDHFSFTPIFPLFPLFIVYICTGEAIISHLATALHLIPFRRDSRKGWMGLNRTGWNGDGMEMG